MAIETAQEAFETYKGTPHRERRWLIRRWADLIKANKDDLAAICTLELGKPFTESLTTVQYAVSFLDWFEGLIERTFGETIPAARGDSRVFTIREPQGVVAAITPWNSPVAMVTRKAGAAIAAGNTVVCKPAPETPLSAIALAKLFERAGGPAGVFNIITTSPELTPAVGDELCHNKLVRHLSFTGSTAVGKYLNTECAKTLKKTSMELGGNAPFIIFEDANIENAVKGERNARVHCLPALSLPLSRVQLPSHDHARTATSGSLLIYMCLGLITSKFRSSGQTCVCANRVLVHSSIIDKVAESLSRNLEKTFVYGSVWDKKVNFGPLYGEKGIKKVEHHLEQALSSGATLHTGGKEAARHEGPNFFPPTVVTGTKVNMKFMYEETFGPIAFLVPFETEQEAIRLANDTDVGLAAYFYTEDISRLWRVSEALKAGMIGARVGLVSAAEMPFGGVRESGMGREGGIAALEEYLDIKAITVGI